MALVSELWSLLTVGNVLLSLLFLLLLHYLVEFYEFRGMPPGPRFYSIPFFGNFLSFDRGAGKSLRESTQSLLKQYGKVFSVRMGSFKVVVAASADSVKEVLVMRSADYAGRPPFHSFKLLTLGGKGIAVGDDGPAWRLHRRLLVTALRQFLMDTPLVEERVTKQAKRLLQFIDEQKGKPFYPERILPKCIANVISAIIFGSRLSSSNPEFSRFLELVNINLGDVDLNEKVGFFDFFPSTKYLPIKAYKRKKDLVEGVHGIIRKQLREAEKEFDPFAPRTDFVCSLIKERYEIIAQNVDDKKILMSEDYLINTISDMFIAGFETVSTTLWWAIAFMANYPDVQSKAQQELDDVVGRDRFPSLDDRPNLPFFQAVIMEVQRLGNIGDITVPHYTLRDTSLCGYRVPKGTMILVSLPAVHLDPECWENPEDFNPYRHIDADGKLNTNQGNWLPFSAGRRVCPGEPFAKVELFLFLSIMLQYFTFLPEKGKEPPSLKGFVSFLMTKPQSFAICTLKRK